MRGSASSARANEISWRCPWLILPPPLAERRVVPLRQGDDEIVRVGRARRRLDRLARCPQLPVADILRDRATEEERLLQHDRDLLAQAGARHLAHVVPVDPHRAAVTS